MIKDRPAVGGTDYLVVQQDDPLSNDLPPLHQQQLVTTTTTILLESVIDLGKGFFHLETS